MRSQCVIAMLYLAILACLAILVAGCSGPVDVPVCDKNAPPSLVLSDVSRGADTAHAFADRGWVSISSDSRSGIVSADCHLSARWV